MQFGTMASDKEIPLTSHTDWIYARGWHQPQITTHGSDNCIPRQPIRQEGGWCLMSTGLSPTKWLRHSETTSTFQVLRFVAKNTNTTPHHNSNTQPIDVPTVDQNADMGLLQCMLGLEIIGGSIWAQRYGSLMGSSIHTIWLVSSMHKHANSNYINKRYIEVPTIEYERDMVLLQRVAGVKLMGSPIWDQVHDNLMGVLMRVILCIISYIYQWLRTQNVY